MSCVSGEFGRKRYNTLDDRAYPSPDDFVLEGGILFLKAFLPYNSQQVVGKNSEMQHQIVRGELPGWKAFQIQISLNLAMELFHRSMLPVKPEDHLRFIRQGGPERVDFYVRNEQELPIGLMSGFDHFKYHSNPFSNVVPAKHGFPYIADFSGTEFFFLSDRLCRFQPNVEGFLPEVPFDDKINSRFFSEANVERIGTVIPTVHTKKEREVADLLGVENGLL